jgi:hypothetical protein
MKIVEIIEKVSQNDPKALAGIPGGKAVSLVRAVFGQITHAIDTTDDGIVQIAGLGRFRVRMVEREIEGKKTFVKRVFFQAPVAKRDNSEKSSS